MPDWHGAGESWKSPRRSGKPGASRVTILMVTYVDARNAADDRREVPHVKITARDRAGIRCLAPSGRHAL